MDDLNPLEGGEVSVKRLPDRIAVTWQAVPEFGTTTLNHFQIEVFFDGRIRITLLGITAVDGLIGLSRGAGVPANFVESNFIAYQTEGPPGVSELNDLVINEDSTTPALDFTVFDVETAAVDAGDGEFIEPGARAAGRSRAERQRRESDGGSHPRRISSAPRITLTVTDGSAMAASEVFAITAIR